MGYTEWRDNLRSGPAAKRHWTAAAGGAAAPVLAPFFPPVLLGVAAGIFAMEISKRNQEKFTSAVNGFDRFFTYDITDYLRNSASAACGIIASMVAIALLASASAAEPQDHGSNDVLDLDKVELVEAAPQTQPQQPAYRFTPV